MPRSAQRQFEERADGAVSRDARPRSPDGERPLDTAAASSIVRRPGDARRGRSRRRWVIWGVLALAIVVMTLIGIRLRNRPAAVTVVRPQWQTLTESIAASGIVGGYREVTVGSQAAGVVSDLRVVEGQRVSTGAVIAVVQNRVAAAQVAQAEQALETARAQLAQQSATPLPSEIASSQSRLDQAKAMYQLQTSTLTKSQVGVSQADAAVEQASAQVDRARRDLESAESQRNLQQKTLDRYRSLYSQGFLAAQLVDQQQAARDTAVDNALSAKSQVAYARAAADAAVAGRRAAAQDVDVARANVRASRAAVDAAEFELRTLKSQPRREPVEVARQQVNNATEALRVAQAQARDTVVTAPFDGIVTSLLAQPGASSAGGIVRLVETRRPEIRCEIDENNLASLRVGLKALITSAAYPGKSAWAHITRIGAQVDSSRGTTGVAVGYDPTIPWLRPGQTVDVNVITHPSVRRMLVPIDAVRRGAAADSVFVVVDGKAVMRRITIGPPAGNRVPVLSGLVDKDAVIVPAEAIVDGARVTVRR